MQIADALRRFTIQLRADGRSPHTVAQYRRHVELLIQWCEAEGHSSDVADVDHALVAEFLASDLARRRHGGGEKLGTTTNALRSSIRNFARYIHAAGFVDRDPGLLIRRARAASAPPSRLGPQEQERLLQALQDGDGGRDLVLFSLLLRAGLRIGEALALTVADVDLETGELQLRRTKGDRPARVPIPRGMRQLLRRYTRALGSGPLFPGRGNQPMTARHANRRLRHWLERAGIRRRLSPHALRHTFATSLYERTGDVLLVQAALRHRSVTSTAVYAHTSAKRLQRALQADY